jgi:glycine/D-amino acid oxidase-like deaminating enzyme
MKAQDVIVVGAGAFGVAAALELRTRGARVCLVDSGPLPHPDAASTDISEAVRMDYGSDELYVELARLALERWHEWNASWPEPLFHEDGFLVMRRTAMTRGNFEGDSYRVLTNSGIPLERLDGEALFRRFPAWESTDYVDG